MDLPPLVVESVNELFSIMEQNNVLKKITDIKKSMILRPGRHSCIYFHSGGELTLFYSNPYLSLGVLWPFLPVGMLENNGYNLGINYKLTNGESLHVVSEKDWDRLTNNATALNYVNNIYAFLIFTLTQSIYKVHAESNNNKIINLVIRYNETNLSPLTPSLTESLFDFIKSRTTLSDSLIHLSLSKLKKEGFIDIRSGIMEPIYDIGPLLKKIT